MLNIFDAAYLAISPFAAGAIGYKYLKYGKYRESAPAMVGKRLREEDSAFWQGGSVWVHAVSVGEVVAAKAVLPYLREAFPAKKLLLTTHTETGQAAGRALGPEIVDAVRYFPVDFSWLIRRYAAVYRPEVFILMETELWPNTLKGLSDYGARIFVFNGKVSQRSFERYLKVGFVFGDALRRISAFGMQTADDAARMQRLCGCADKVHVTGNVKFDVDIPPVSDAEAAALRDMLRVPAGSPIVVAGSTHRGEEDIMLEAWRGVAARYPDATLVIVPRHPERFDEVWGLIRQKGFAAVRVSTGESTGPGEARVVLVDRMGLLGRIYGIVEIAVVAGSFIDGIGGHNLMEASAHGVPVIYGPYMKAQADMVRILSAAGGAICVAPDDLARELILLLEDPAKGRQIGSRGQKAYLENRGSSVRNLDMLKQSLGM